jgi:hypothetical protein
MSLFTVKKKTNAKSNMIAVHTWISDLMCFNLGDLIKGQITLFLIECFSNRKFCHVVDPKLFTRKACILLVHAVN